MRILISNQQNRQKVVQKELRKIIRKLLIYLGYEDVEISILLVDDCRIQEINRQYLSRNGPTDVIAFSMREGEFSEINPHLLGDVVVSLETAFRQAKERGLPFEDEVSLLIIHGLLHLTGYNHENCDEKTASRMRKKEKELFKIIKNESKFHEKNDR